MCRRQIHHPEGAGCMCRSPYGFWPHTLHLRHTCHPDTRGHILALPGCKLLCPRSPHLSYSLPPDSGRMDFPAVPVCTHILGCGSQPGSQHSDHIELWGMGQHTLEICMLCQQDNQGFSRIHLQNCQFEYVMIMKNDRNKPTLEADVMWIASPSSGTCAYSTMSDSLTFGFTSTRLVRHIARIFTLVLNTGPVIWALTVNSAFTNFDWEENMTS